MGEKQWICKIGRDRIGRGENWKVYDFGKIFLTIYLFINFLHLQKKKY